jgi:hypothetical protein
MSYLIKPAEPDEAIPDDGKALALMNWISEKSINGVSPLCSAEDLAKEYRADNSYSDDGARIQSLINYETTKNFTVGFITGLGGAITLPVAIPVALGASWIIQARLAAAVAGIAGYDLESDRVRTFVMACLLGGACKDVVKTAGVRLGNGLAKTTLQKIPRRALIEINKKVGFRLLTKAGQKGVVNLTKMIPIAGGLVAGAVDAGACQIVGKQAADLFYYDRNP